MPWDDVDPYLPSCVDVLSVAHCGQQVVDQHHPVNQLYC